MATESIIPAAGSVLRLVHADMIDDRPFDAPSPAARRRAIVTPAVIRFRTVRGGGSPVAKSLLDSQQVAYPTSSSIRSPMQTASTWRSVVSTGWLALTLPSLVACSPAATSDDAMATTSDGGSPVIVDAGVEGGASARKDAASTIPHDAGDGADAGKPTPAPHWVAAWADAPDSEGTTSGGNRTYREIVKPTVGSRGKVRLHFSNFFGTAPVTLGAVHIGVQTSGAAVAGDVAVSFGGKSGTTIAAHDFATSDEIAFSFAYGDVLAVTEYVSGSFTALTQHQQGGGLVTSYATAVNAGDKTSDVGGTAFGEHTPRTYLLDRVDVYGD
jgi:hypothetical protein